MVGSLKNKFLSKSKKLMKRFSSSLGFLGTLLAVLTTGVLMASVAHTAIATSGDIAPDDPSTWTIWNSAYIGYNDTGALTITDGSSVTNGSAYIGYGSDASGIVTVDGVGSAWVNNGVLSVGEDGTGTLAITDGSSVTNGYAYIGYGSDASGIVTVDGVGSTLNSSGGIHVGNYGTGTLAVINGSSVTIGSSSFIGYYSGSSGNVTVDGKESKWSNSHDLNIGFEGTGTLTIANGGSVTSGSGNIGSRGSSDGAVTVDGTESTWISSGTINVGQGGNGTLNITNGGSVVDGTAYIAYASNSIGTVSVDGEGSSWTNNYLYVGRNGTGALTITNGGSVTDDFAVIAYDYDSSGLVSVNGEGSSWINNSYIHVGHYQSSPGSLSVTDGGLVSASTVAVSSNSIVTVDVNSELKVGTADNNWNGDIDNYGTIRLVAGAMAASGIYTPMSYGTIKGDDGTIQTLGGTWDESAHAITVSDAITAQGAGGATATLDLAENQRVLITDSDTGMSVGASFLGTDTSTEISLTATAISEDDLLSLESLLAETGASILSSWNFSTEDYTVSTDTPVYLSLYADSAADLLDLVIWHLDGEWTEYDASDLAFDGTWASFIATGFSGYAVTATSAVPVPAAMWLLGSGLLCLMSLRRRMG